MNRQRLVFIGVAAIVLLAAVYFLVPRQASGDSVTLSGNVDIREVNLSFRVGGRLKHLNVDEGATVHTGDLLGELDDVPYRLALNDAISNHAALLAHKALYREGYRKEDIAQASATVQARLASLLDAQQGLRRQEQLAGTGASAQRLLDDARSQRDQAQAALDGARQQLQELSTGYRKSEVAEVNANADRASAQLDQAQLQLSDTRLLAPADGTILTRAVEPGTMLAPGATVLTLSLDRPVWVRAYVGEPDLGKAVPGRHVKVSCDASSHTYDGVIGFVSPTAEFTPKNVETTDLRTALVYRLRIMIQDPDSALRQGMPVSVQLKLH